MKLNAAQVIACIALFFMPHACGQVLLAQAYLTNAVGGPGITPSFSLRIGCDYNGSGWPHGLFEDLSFRNQDGGRTFTIGPGGDPYFAPFVAQLTDGSARTVCYCEIAAAGYIGCRNIADFFNVLSPGTNGSGFVGCRIDYVSLHFNVINIASPGGNPNGDGVWTDAGFSAIFSIYGQAPSKPSLATQPQTQTAEVGSGVLFRVGITNTLPGPTYQWYFNGTSALGSATNSDLHLTNVQPAQTGAYTVVVTNLMGAVTSAPALLNVIPPVDRRVVPGVHLTGGIGNLLHLEYADSLNPQQWSSLTNLTLNGGPQNCFDLCQPLPAQRFYRAWQTNGPRAALEASMATEIPLTVPMGSKVRVDYINQVGPTDAWVTLDTVLLTNTPQYYYDLTAFRQPTRLYRLVPIP